MNSWGYLKDRCHHLGRNMIKELSRISLENDKNSEYNEETTKSEMRIKGRIVLDVWRLLRHEVRQNILVFYKVYSIKFFKFIYFK